MALTKTSLAAAMTANDLECRVASATGATVGGIIQIGNEYAVITSITGTVIGLRSRGDRGTKATSHIAGEPVVFGLASDIVTPPFAESDARVPLRDIRYYRASGAIELPNKRDMIAVIGVGAAAAHAMTLADPPALADGLMIHIVSDSAYAHTVTLTTGYGGSAATDVFTFAGNKGDSITLMALHGTWSHVATGLTAAEAVSASVA